MAENRVPYNSQYCREVKCPRRSGNKCEEPRCIRNGTEKRAAYFTTHGKLADGDVPNA